MTRRSAQELLKPLKAQGYGSGLGESSMSVDELRKVIVEAASGDDDAMSMVIARLAPDAWHTAHCLADRTEAVRNMTIQGLVTLVRQIASNRGEYDPSVEVVRTTREARTAAVNPIKMPKKRRLFRSGANETPKAQDPYAAIAFAALPNDLRFALWHLEVKHFTPATVARITGKATREIEDLARKACLGFRRYYVEAIPRESVTAKCSAALDQIPDFVSGRLDGPQIAALEAHFADCPKCEEVATSLRSLQGRLLDAMPAMSDAVLETAAFALVTEFSHSDIDLTDAAMAAPIAVPPVVAVDTIDLTAETADLDDEGGLVPDTRARRPDARTWWLRDRQPRVIIIGAAAVILSVASATVFATQNTPPVNTEEQASATTTTPPTTAPDGTQVPNTVSPTTAPPPTTTEARAPDTRTSATTTTAPTRAVTTTTARPSAPVAAPPATSAPATTTTTRAPNFSIVDLPGSPAPTTTAPPATTTTQAP